MTRMNVLVVHNRYREAGGEDRVVELETALLQQRGHTVIPYVADNHHIGNGGLALAVNTIWNPRTYRGVRELLARESVDVVHVHNTFPLISPAVYYAAGAAGVPVVQTVHNYRLVCPGGVCVRNGAACTRCVGAAVPWQAVRHACYRKSRAATAAVTAMLVAHRVAGTWQRAVDAYIAPTPFARRLLIAGGLPAARIVIKPHFVDPDPGVGTGAGGYALYAGRLSEEKGVRLLLDAWRRLQGRVELRLAGDGPLAHDVSEAARTIPRVTWLGRQGPTEIARLVAAAAFLVSPSIAFETFGQVIAESFAAGTPVIASAGGAAADLVEHGRTGLLARHGDAADLAAQVTRLLDRPADVMRMRAAARDKYEAAFTADTNYRSLLRIYDTAAAHAASHGRVRTYPAVHAAAEEARP